MENETEKTRTVKIERLINSVKTAKKFRDLELAAAILSEAVLIERIMQ